MTPIITSLLDIDFYKLTMAQVAFLRHPDVEVTYAFINRTSSFHVAEHIDEDELRAQLERARALRFRDDELAYLRESPYLRRGLFRDEFLDFLARLELPAVLLERDGETYRIEVTAPWPRSILWETVILSIVTELLGAAYLHEQGLGIGEAWAEGDRRLDAKVAALCEEPAARFTDFGTRRRFSGAWQRRVVERLAAELPEQLAGTSNVLLARSLRLPPIGTYAHEMDMVYSGVYRDSDDALRASHQRVLDAWWEQYGEELSIALTDTYTTEFFLRAFPPELARRWRGVRQDSGDPFAFAERVIAFYEAHGIDPCAKTIVFSDSLDGGLIVRLYRAFHERIGVAFGWGTNLTNDLGFTPPSLVVKPVSAAGQPLVKLSDNLDKAIGAQEEIKRFQELFAARAIPRMGVRY